MTPTEDAEKINDAETKAKSAGKWITYVGGALIAMLVPAITAHQLAVSEGKSAAAKVAATTVDLAAQAKTQGQQTKNEAEAGYQVTRQAMEALEHRVLVLERSTHRRRVKAPAALPTDLKQAEKVVFAAAPAHVPIPPTVPPAPTPSIVPYRDAAR